MFLHYFADSRAGNEEFWGIDHLHDIRKFKIILQRNGTPIESVNGQQHQQKKKEKPDEDEDYSVESSSSSGRIQFRLFYCLIQSISLLILNASNDDDHVTRFKGEI